MNSIGQHLPFAIVLTGKSLSFSVSMKFKFYVQQNVGQADVTPMVLVGDIDRSCQKKKHVSASLDWGIEIIL